MNRLTDSDVMLEAALERRRIPYEMLDTGQRRLCRESAKAGRRWYPEDEDFGDRVRGAGWSEERRP